MENLAAMLLPLLPTTSMSTERLLKQKKKVKRTTTTTTMSKRRRDDDDDNNGNAAGEEDGDCNNNDRNDENAINAMAIANKIKSEHAQRHIATRGIIALFNAIWRHRSAVAAKAVERRIGIRYRRRGGCACSHPQGIARRSRMAWMQW